MKQRIETEDDYRKALSRFLEICDAPEGSEESRELFRLIELMESYEQEECS